MQLCFGGDEAAFAGGFEDGGAVAFEVGLHPAQRGHPGLQAGELFFDFGYDAALFGEGWERHINSPDVVQSEANFGRTSL
jgi:hypothetical protein